MATWGDYLSLTLTLSLIAALVYGVLYINQSVRKVVSSTKEQLHNRGIDVSAKGASVKTHTKLQNREEYFDATQRGIVKALSKSSFGRDEPGTGGHTRTDSATSRKSFKSRAHS
ncbi:hypothetical protein BDW22DRAFT_1429972 [Trametopsis cervina]|nr:hypothetical protein BDW22DRAFT_1429972 [Trametopsis cervina]